MKNNEKPIMVRIKSKDFDVKHINEIAIQNNFIQQKNGIEFANLNSLMNSLLHFCFQLHKEGVSLSILESEEVRSLIKSMGTKN